MKLHKMKHILTFLFALMSIAASAQSNNALNFDGGNDRVYIGDYPQFSPAHITVQAWVKMDYVGGWTWRGVVTKRYCCGHDVEEWTMQTEVGFVMSFHASLSNGQSTTSVTDPNPMIAGEWHEFTATYDGNRSILYRDGIVVAKDSSVSGNILSTSYPVIIGDRDGGEDWFPGSIDEVRIWDHALTQDEIIATMNCELTGNESGLIAYYNFDQGVAGADNSSVTTLTDHGPNHFDGSLQNFSLNGASSNWVSTGYPSLSASISAEGNTTVCKPSSVVLDASPSSGGLNYQWKKGNTTLAGATNSKHTATKTGTYKCIVTNACGSTTSNSISVTVNPLPSASIAHPDGLDLCGHTSLLLQANTGVGLTYQWMKGNAQIPGATNSSYSATAKATYKVIVTNSSGCSKTSAGAKVVKTCREESAAAMDDALSVFPNPSDGKFTLALPETEASEAISTIEIFNLVGQLIQSKSGLFNMPEVEIEFPSETPSGIYLIRVQDHGRFFQKKVILEK